MLVSPTLPFTESPVSRLGCSYYERQLNDIPDLLTQDLEALDLQDVSTVSLKFGHNMKGNISEGTIIVEIINPNDENQRIVLRARCQEDPFCCSHFQYPPCSYIDYRIDPPEDPNLGEQWITLMYKEDDNLGQSEVRQHLQKLIAQEVGRISKWTGVSKNRLLRLPEASSDISPCASFTTFASHPAVSDLTEFTTSVTPAVESGFVFQSDGLPATEQQTKVAKSCLHLPQNGQPFKITVDDLRIEYSGWNPAIAGNQIRSDFLVTDRVKRLICDLFPDGLQGEEILVPGCGSGEFSIWLAEQGATVTSFDLLPDQIERAIQQLADCDNKELKRRATFQVGNVTDLSFLPENKRYDMIITLMLHLYLDGKPGQISGDEEFKQSFREFSRRLKPGGLGIYGNDFPPRYGQYLNGGRNLYTVDGGNPPEFFDDHPSLHRSLRIRESYPKPGFPDFETKNVIHPTATVLNSLASNGLKFLQAFTPEPASEELAAYPELMAGSDIIPPYWILLYTYDPKPPNGIKSDSGNVASTTEISNPPYIAGVNQDFAKNVFMGLSQPSGQKFLSSDFIYDENGSRLFEQIMGIPDYYPTRCEEEILTRQAVEMVNIISCDLGRSFNLYELGAGNGEKTRILLRTLQEYGLKFKYLPNDIDGSILSKLQASAISEFPTLDLQCLEGDYSQAFGQIKSDKTPKVVLFLGSTLGNFGKEKKRKFLTELRSSLDPGDLLLVGLDLFKDPEILRKAYNDPDGIIRQFNLNLLARINTELGGEFDLNDFYYTDIYDPVTRSMMAYLISKKEQSVRIEKLGLTVHLDEGEPIFTEFSDKLTPKLIDRLADQVGFEVADWFFDSKRYFADVVLRAV